MSSIFVDDSDEFDADSLNHSIDDSQFEVCESQLDIKEIPESPLDSRSSRLNFSNKIEMNSSDSVGSKKNFRNASKSLPNVYLRKDQAVGQEKILDYRDIVRKKLNKSNNFGSMKFKDFKQAQKALKKDNYGSLHDVSPSEAKKAKIEIQQQNEDKDNVAQKMLNLKQTLNILNEYVNTMQSKQVPRNKFINTRKSVIPEHVNNIIVDKTIEKIEDIDNDDDSLYEIPDSLENSETEVLESDLEDYAKEESSLQTKPQMSLFIRSRPTLDPKGPLYVNETIYEMDNENQMTQPSSEKDLNEFQVNDTFDAIHNDNHNSSAANLSLPNSSSKNLESVRKNTSIHTNNVEVKMKFFKKKKNTNLADSSNGNVVPSRNKQSDEGGKMLQTSARKNYHKQLLAFLCKQCQDDYATHDLSEEQMKKLIKECDRHRNRQKQPKSSHHTSNHFWDTDFPSSPESTPRGKHKTAAKLPISKQTNVAKARPDVRKKVRKNQLELYNEWEADIDLNSRDSNVLHSTFIPRN